jgi:hypothetical protein
MDNPYQASAVSPPERSSRAVLARITAVVLHLLILTAFILLAGPILGRYVGDAPMLLDIPDAELTAAESFNRFFIMYGFLPIMICFLLDLAVWGMLRWSGRRPTRWRWLGITTVLIPITFYLSWLIMWPALAL